MQEKRKLITVSVNMWVYSRNLSEMGIEEDELEDVISKLLEGDFNNPIYAGGIRTNSPFLIKSIDQIKEDSDWE